jgi:hypothetical protein
MVEYRYTWKYKYDEIVSIDKEEGKRTDLLLKLKLKYLKQKQRKRFPLLSVHFIHLKYLKKNKFKFKSTRQVKIK